MPPIFIRVQRICNLIIKKMSFRENWRYFKIVPSIRSENAKRKHRYGKLKQSVVQFNWFDYDIWQGRMAARNDTFKMCDILTPMIFLRQNLKKYLRKSLINTYNMVFYELTSDFVCVFQYI